MPRPATPATSPAAPATPATSPAAPATPATRPATPATGGPDRNGPERRAAPRGARPASTPMSRADFVADLLRDGSAPRRAHRPDRVPGLHPGAQPARGTRCPHAGRRGDRTRPWPCTRTATSAHPSPSWAHPATRCSTRSPALTSSRMVTHRRAAARLPGAGPDPKKTTGRLIKSLPPDQPAVRPLGSRRRFAGIWDAACTDIFGDDRQPLLTQIGRSAPRMIRWAQPIAPAVIIPPPAGVNA